MMIRPMMAKKPLPKNGADDETKKLMKTITEPITAIFFPDSNCTLFTFGRILKCAHNYFSF
jgi:hypothetical protein